MWIYLAMMAVRCERYANNTDSELVCPAVFVDRIQLRVRAVFFMGAVGLAHWYDIVPNIWHPLLQWHACILLIDGQDV